MVVHTFFRPRYRLIRRSSPQDFGPEYRPNQRTTEQA